MSVMLLLRSIATGTGIGIGTRGKNGIDRPVFPMSVAMWTALPPERAQRVETSLSWPRLGFETQTGHTT